jgi:hypothetical protein
MGFKLVPNRVEFTVKSAVNCKELEYLDVTLYQSTLKDVAWPRSGGEGEAKKMEPYISVSRQTDR